MKRFEKAFVNSPFTTIYHRHIALPRVLLMARRPIEAPLLEVGCGKGTTTRGLLARLPGMKITAIDYDPDQVARARKTLGTAAQVEQGDVTALRHEDASFGTVVELNTLHHMADWHIAVSEVNRVLKPGGQFLFMDYTEEFFRGPLGRWFPPESRFTPDAFTRTLEAAGFKDIIISGRRIIWGAAVRR